MNDEEIIYLFVACDKNFLKHLIVLINSAKYKSSKKIKLFLGVSSKKISDYFEEKLSFSTSSDFCFEIIIFGEDQLNKIFDNYITDHPVECYFRLMIGKILPLYVNKVIYLDADVIIQDDLSKLYNYPIQNIIGGVIDFIGENSYKKRIETSFNIKIEKYIYAGMLLINLKKWREIINEQKMINFLDKNFHLLPLQDMDLLNIFLNGNITDLDPRWNQVIAYGTKLPKNINNPGIYHLIGQKKADNILYPHYSIRKMYLFFLGQESSLLNDIWEIFIYLFLGKPIGIFYFYKNKIRYKYEKIKIWNYFTLFLILYPPVFIYLGNEIYKQYKKRGVKEVVKRIKKNFGKNDL